LRVEPLAFAGAFLLHGFVHQDERGAFRRVLDVAVAAEAGLDARVAQISVASNTRRGTVRGMHYQVSPHDEAKTLWCTTGAVFDVLVDLRPAQPTYGHVWSVTLAAGDPFALHVPAGVAHGYQALADGTDLTYVISVEHHAASARSINALDPGLGIPWPLPVTVMSARDREAPTWQASR
jgi:dTDP-4-dehydrorhamnose 3,5-epimerase